MTSAIGLRQAFPMHTNRTLVRLECRAPESAFFSFSTFRTLRCPPLDLFPPQRALGNVHARWCRLSIQDGTWPPECGHAALTRASRRTPPEPSGPGRPGPEEIGRAHV